MHITLRPCTTFSRGRTLLPGTISSAEKLPFEKGWSWRQPRKTSCSKITKGKINFTNLLFFFFFQFLGGILFAGDGQFSQQPLSHIISYVSISCRTGFAAQHSGLLHLFSRSCSEIRSVLPMQDVPVHVPPGETIVSDSVVCADNHRGTLASKSCPEREWHLTLKVQGPGIPNGIEEESSI